MDLFNYVEIKGLYCVITCKATTQTKTPLNRSYSILMHGLRALNPPHPVNPNICLIYPQPPSPTCPHISYRQVQPPRLCCPGQEGKQTKWK